MMTEAGIVNLVNKDLESGNITSTLVAPQNEDIDMQSVYRKRSDSIPVSNVAQSLCFKSIISLIILAFGSPFIICDLYYAYTDTTCVHNPTKKLNVDMYQYLMVNGYMGVSIMGLIVFTIFMLKEKDIHAKNSECTEVFTIMFKYLLLLFGTSWTIVGGIIFWHEIDNSTCSKPVYNYLTASLIIKIVSISFAWRNENNKNKK